jgi:hypothetical protein
VEKENRFENLNRLFPLLYFGFLYFYGVKFLNFSVVDWRGMEKFPILRELVAHLTPIFAPQFKILGVRLVPLLFSVGSFVLFYQIVKSRFHREREIFYITSLYLLLPGTILSTLLVNKGVVLLFLTFLVLYCYLNGWKIATALLLLLYSGVDGAMINLFLGFLGYGLYRRSWKLTAVATSSLLLSLYFYPLEIGGVPRSHFGDLILTYSAIYSPFLFFYFLYTLYRVTISPRKGIIYFITAAAFLLSLFLSFRQRIKIDDYAPFTLPFIVYIVQQFLTSYRVRLRPFRRGYRLLLYFLFGSMLATDLLLFLNPLKQEVGSSYYFTRKLALTLECTPICTPPELCKSLEFYRSQYPTRHCRVKYSKKRGGVVVEEDNKTRFLPLSRLYSPNF